MSSKTCLAANPADEELFLLGVDAQVAQKELVLVYRWRGHKLSY